MQYLARPCHVSSVRPSVRPCIDAFFLSFFFLLAALGPERATALRRMYQEMKAEVAQDKEEDFEVIGKNKRN